MSAPDQVFVDTRCEGHHVTVNAPARSALCECGEAWRVGHVQWLGVVVGQHIGKVQRVREIVEEW